MSDLDSKKILVMNRYTYICMYKFLKDARTMVSLHPRPQETLTGYSVVGFQASIIICFHVVGFQASIIICFHVVQDKATQLVTYCH